MSGKRGQHGNGAARRRLGSVGEYEHMEEEAQRELAVRLHERGIPMDAIVARVGSIGLPRSRDLVSHWIRRSEATRRRKG